MPATPAILLALLVAASCASLERGHRTEVSAAAEAGGVRVRFRRLSGADTDRPPELRAQGGALEQVVYSPDLKAVSALWRDPHGTLSCRFPYDGTASFGAEEPAEPAIVTYVFLEAEGARVTAALPRGCLLLPAVPLRLHIPGDLAPARIVLPDGRSFPAGEEVLLPLTTDERGVLRRGDMPVTLATAKGKIEFLVGIDDDGTPAAVSGYVESPEDDVPAPRDR